MATHDYVLANASGAAFRTDLNNALAAIVSNNSNSSQPATRYAYMWWADTTNGVLKIRNSANDGWVELLQLDGTLTLEDGSVSAPGLAFRDDLDTGIFSSSANTFCVATAGVERMELGTAETSFNEDGLDVNFRIESDNKSHMFFIDAGNDRIGINESAPSTTFHISGSENTTIAYFDTDLGGRGLKINTFASGGAASAGVELEAPAGAAKSAFVFKGASEFMRLDTSGNLALGTSSIGSVNGEIGLKFGMKSNNNNVISFETSNATTNRGLLLESRLTGRSGSETFAQMHMSQESGGAGGFISFYVASNASASTERVRIDSLGRVLVGSGAIATPKASTHGLDVACNNMSIVFGADSNSGNNTSARTNNTLKDQRIAAVHYTNSEEPVGVVRVLSDSSTSEVFFGGGSSLFNAATQLSFYTASTNTTANGSQRMQIDSAGRVSIGTTTNTAHFNVHVNAASRVPMIINDTSNTSTFTHRLRFDTGNTEVGRIRASNSATVYDTSASDITLKKNFENWTENTLDLFRKINPQKFHFIQEEDTTEKSKGFIAQEMVNSFPEAYTKEDKKDSKYFFNPSGMVVYLMKAIQELEAKVAALEAT